MSLVSILEDIEKIREDNSRLAGAVPAQQISAKEAAKEIERLLAQCQVIGRWLEYFSKLSIDDVPEALFNAKKELATAIDEREKIVSENNLMKKNFLRILGEKENTLVALRAENKKLAAEAALLTKHRADLREMLERKDRDIRSLRYRTRLKGSLAGPGKKQKPR